MKTRVTYLALALLFLSFAAVAQTPMQTRSFTIDKATVPDLALASGKGDRVAQIEVTFDIPFDTKPEIVIAVSSLDAPKETNLRYSVKAMSVSRDGFILQVKTWEDSKIFGIGGTWLAYAVPAEKK